MPPNLRDGVVRGHHKQAMPSAQMFCTCYECTDHWETDRGRLEEGLNFVRGRYLGPVEYKRHRARVLQSGIASARLARTPDNLAPPPEMTFPVVPNLLSLASFTKSPRPTTGMPTHTDHVLVCDLARAQPEEQYRASTVDVSSNAQTESRSAPTVTKPASSFARPRKMKSSHKPPQIDFSRKRLDDIKLTFTNFPVKALIKQTKDDPLVFLNPPTPSSPPISLSLASLHSLRLDDQADNNSTMVGHEKWLSDTQAFLKKQSTRNNSITSQTRLLSRILLTRADQEIAAMTKFKQEEWERQRIAAVNTETDSLRTGMYIFVLYSSHSSCAMFSEEYTSHPFRQMDPGVCLCYLLITVLHLFCGVSIDHCAFILPSLQLLVGLLLAPHDAAEAAAARRSIPSDVRTVLGHMNLEPVYKSYICCPKCFCTYNAEEPYPDHCTHQNFPDDEPCGRRLRRKRRRGDIEIDVPTREYLQQEIDHYLARLYAIPRLESLLDQDLLHQQKEEMSDIWDASALREFLGPDGKSFHKGPGNEGRLVFSLNMDGFNPLTNKQAGKKNSTGGIYMVCLNLPPSLRYNVENMLLVGVIPGPREPSLDQINHLLRPLVDDLLRLWHHGVYLSSTALHHSGRRVRIAVIPLVCDLPAARQMAGFGSFSSTNFCSECYQTLADMDNLDYKNWTHRTRCNHLASARLWQEASTEDERTDLVKEHGVRWSELLRLPYWDPTQYVTIDSMHCFYLGLFRRHIQEVWGMSVKLEDGEGISFETKDIGTEKATTSWQILRTGSVSQLRKLQRDVLVHLCRQVGLRFAGTQTQLFKRLELYVCILLLSSSVRFLSSQFIQRVKAGWFNAQGELIKSPTCTESTSHAEISGTANVTSLPAAKSTPSGPVQTSFVEKDDQMANNLYDNATSKTVARQNKKVIINICHLRLSPITQKSSQKYSEMTKDQLCALIEVSVSTATITLIKLYQL